MRLGREPIFRYASNDFRVELHENHLMGGGKYYAVPVNMKTLDNDDIIKNMEAPRKTSGVDIAVLKEILDSYNAAVLDRIRRGFRVNTGLCTMSLGVHGIFDNVNEQFSADKHKLVVRLSPTAALKGAVSDVRTVTSHGSANEPHLSGVPDSAESGALLELRGGNIKIVGDDERCGVWFISEQDGTETGVTRDRIAVNTQNHVVAVVPPLPAGRYRIRLTTQYAGPGTRARKEPCSAVWGGALSVL